jgi:hypothetical protein
MTVSDLISRLESFPPETEVWISGDGQVGDLRLTGNNPKYLVILTDEDTGLPEPESEKGG